MPTILPKESRSHYVSRCVSVVLKEAGTKSTAHAIAKCGGMWDQVQKKRSTTNRTRISRYNPLKADPTRTTTLRRIFETEFRRRFNKLKAKILRLVDQEDAFGLRQSQNQEQNNDRGNESIEPRVATGSLARSGSIEPGIVGQDYKTRISGGDVKAENRHSDYKNGRSIQNIILNQRWAARSNPNKVKAFNAWLQTQVQANIITTTAAKAEDAYWTAYIEEGYRKGAGRAFDDTRASVKAAMDAGNVEQLAFYEGTKTEFLQSSFGRPVAINKVKLLAGRVFTDLNNITVAMSANLTRALTDGLVQGQNPRDIARRMIREGFGTKTRGIQSRAERLARTEIIRAHAEGQLDAMENLGVTEVGVMVEWSTAGDDRVCELCSALDGVVLSIKEARGILPRHPNCRCAHIPANVGESKKGQTRGKGDIQGAFDKSIKAESPKRALAKQKQITKWAGADTTIVKQRPEGILGKPKPEFRSRAAPIRKAPEKLGMKTWFGNSKIVDSRGRPKVMYRGTAGEQLGAHGKEGRNLVFVTPKKKFAQQYAAQFPRGKVHRVYVKSERVIDISRDDWELFKRYRDEKDVGYSLYTKTDEGIALRWTEEQPFRAWLKKEGIKYDSIYFAENDGSRSLALSSSRQLRKASDVRPRAALPKRAPDRISKQTTKVVEKLIKKQGWADSVTLKGLTPREAQSVLRGLKKSMKANGIEFKLKILNRSERAIESTGFGWGEGKMSIGKGGLAGVRKHVPGQAEKWLKGTGAKRNFVMQAAKNSDEALQFAIAHEAGHHIETALLLDVQKAVRGIGGVLEKELVKLSGYASTHPTEMFAELHSAMVIRPSLVPNKLKRLYKRILATADPDPIKQYIKKMPKPKPSRVTDKTAALKKQLAEQKAKNLAAQKQLQKVKAQKEAAEKKAQEIKAATLKKEKEAAALKKRIKAEKAKASAIDKKLKAQDIARDKKLKAKKAKAKPTPKPKETAALKAELQKLESESLKKVAMFERLEEKQIAMWDAGKRRGAAWDTLAKKVKGLRRRIDTLENAIERVEVKIALEGKPKVLKRVPIAKKAPVVKDPLTFDKARITRSGYNQKEAHKELERQLGRKVSREEVGNLAGARDGARVTTVDVPGGMGFTTEGKGYEAITQLKINARVLYVDEIFIEEAMQGKGLGTEVIGRIVGQAKKMGYTVELEAASGISNTGEVMNGYYAWARLGFDGPLPHRWLSQAQAAGLKNVPGYVKEATKVSELMKTKRGREIWKDFGSTIDLSMSTKPGSKELKILEQYIARKRGL